jgi:hypothetical protein
LVDIRRIDTGLDVTASITQPYAAPELALTYSPSVLGVGLGAKSYIAMLYGDVLIGPYLRGEIGAFYLHLGAAFEASGPVERSGKVDVSINDLDIPATPLVALGWKPTVYETDSGEWSLDIGLEGFISTVYVDEPDDPGEAVGFAAVAPLVAAFNVPKANIGVTYSFDL